MEKPFFEALAARRQHNLDALREKHFLAPGGHNLEFLLQLIRQSLITVIQHEGNGPVFPVTAKTPLTEVRDGAEIPKALEDDPLRLISSLPESMQGCVKANNPYLAKNIIPVPSLVHLATNLAVSLYMPNAVTGEDSADVLNAEIACASAISKLAGYDERQSAGLFTFGGTGTNFYGFKMGLYKVAPDHGMEGVPKDIVIIGSKPSHYSHQTGANWLGIGQNNYLQVRSNLDQTTKLDELEQACRKAIEQKKKIACIEAVGGTTSNMAIDDFEAIYEMRERLVQEYGMNYRPHIHADAVLGWAYLNFVHYDFEQNTLGFSPNVILRIQKILSRISKLKFVDSFGVDFHKTGFMPYVSSMVLARDKNDLGKLRRDGKIMTPLFHDEEAYNPGTFSLETSRSAANILATWYGIQAIGQEGYQTLLGHSLEMSEHMRERLLRYETYGLHAANQEPYGCDIFVRCYPEGTHPSIQKQEINDDRLLQQYNEYTTLFAKWLFAHKTRGDNGIGLSKSSAALYTDTGSPMTALRIYPLNPYITSESADILIDRLAEAKHEFNHL